MDQPNSSAPETTIHGIIMIVAIPILALLLLALGPLATVRPKHPRWVFLRSILLVSMWIAFYAALPVLSLSVVAAALYPGPLFIALFSALLIREPVELRRGMALVLGFIGVLVALRPGTDAFSYTTLARRLGDPLGAGHNYHTQQVLRGKAVCVILALECFLFAGRSFRDRRHRDLGPRSTRSLGRSLPVRQLGADGRA